MSRNLPVLDESQPRQTMFVKDLTRSNEDDNQSYYWVLELDEEESTDSNREDLMVEHLKSTQIPRPSSVMTSTFSSSRHMEKETTSVHNIRNRVSGAMPDHTKTSVRRRVGGTSPYNGLEIAEEGNSSQSDNSGEDNGEDDESSIDTAIMANLSMVAPIVEENESMHEHERTVVKNSPCNLPIWYIVAGIIILILAGIFLVLMGMMNMKDAASSSSLPSQPPDVPTVKVPQNTTGTKMPTPNIFPAESSDATLAPSSAPTLA